MNSRREVLHETLIVFLGELIVYLIMIGIFALAGALDGTVWLGGAVGQEPDTLFLHYPHDSDFWHSAAACQVRALQPVCQHYSAGCGALDSDSG